MCLVLVVGLIVSDWAEKRRMRELLRAKEAARQALRNNRSAPGPQLVTPAKPAFRIFRWEFAALSILVAAFVYSSIRSKQEVKAHEEKVPAEAQAAKAAEVAVAKQIPAAIPAAAPKPAVASNGGSVNPDALFQFDTRSDFGDTPRDILAPGPAAGGSGLQDNRAKFGLR